MLVVAILAGLFAWLARPHPELLGRFYRWSNGSVSFADGSVPWPRGWRNYGPLLAVDWSDGSVSWYFIRWWWEVLMNLPRFRIRMLMIAVAMVAFGLATIVFYRRSQNFTSRAQDHEVAFVISCTTPEYVSFHSALAEKYRRAARYPWLPVEPDPPEPRWEANCAASPGLNGQLSKWRGTSESVGKARRNGVEAIMRLPRMTTRRWMIVVAVVALLFWLVTLCRQLFQRSAPTVADPFDTVEMLGPVPPDPPAPGGKLVSVHLNGPGGPFKWTDTNFHAKDSQSTAWRGNPRRDHEW
jgi:hypothetical protein